MVAAHEELGAQSGVTAVSYTHLDVYKRQDIDAVGNSESLALRNISIKLIVNSTAERRSARPNAQNSEIDARSFNCVPINTPLVLSLIHI